MGCTLFRPNQARHLERTHGPMGQTGESRIKSALEIALPVRSPHRHAAPPAFQNAGGSAGEAIRSTRPPKSC
jgi:hypothetical protein